MNESAQEILNDCDDATRIDTAEDWRQAFFPGLRPRLGGFAR